MKNIIFFGYGSENLLEPVKKLFLNENLIEINNFNSNYNLNSLKDKTYDVIVFSSHLNLNSFLYAYHYEKIKNFIDPLDLLKELKIKKKIYLIHDLSEFYLNDEIYHLDLMDLILSPIDYDDPLFMKKIFNVGWIKNFDISLATSITGKRIFFMSDIGFYEKNFEIFIKDFASFVGKFDYFKLPKMNNLPIKIKNFFIDNGVREINSNENVNNYLEQNDIYTNGLSSIIFETLLKKNKINVIKSATNEFINWDNVLKNPLSKLKLVKNISINKNIIQISPNDIDVDLSFKKEKFKSLF
tara:strand:+ start:942 stop:1835 length:894 start_codon:yes stop_codon:yes gene_type:complete